MYTLLIVDDEEIEREGMAQFIPWDSYEIKVVSTARNGAEGLEKIAKFRPDLAIVDIKMPVMNGIEMIRQAKEQYPDMTFVVLSGYGDYEFTSQAMELGVRHYILKPCDESKMIPVLNKAFAELEEARKKNARSEKLETEARLLKPYAREQLFRDLLLGKAQASSGARQLVDELGGEQRMVLLLDFRLKCGFDSLERYVVGNMPPVWTGMFWFWQMLWRNPVWKQRFRCSKKNSSGLKRFQCFLLPAGQERLQSFPCCSGRRRSFCS